MWIWTMRLWPSSTPSPSPISITRGTCCPSAPVSSKEAAPSTACQQSRSSDRSDAIFRRQVSDSEKRQPEDLTMHFIAHVTTHGLPVPVVNQIRTYWWCSPPRIGRQRICPASSTAREIGASFSKDKCVRVPLQYFMYDSSR